MDIDDPERMRMIDSLWLDIRQADAPIAVGAVLEFSGRAPAVDRVRRRIAEMLPAVPRLRQVPHSSRSGVLQPKWADAELDLEVHVTRQTVKDLSGAVSELMARPMTADRPLWDVTIFSGYAPREWALVWRLHHSVADGEGVTMLVGRTLDMTPEGGVTLTDWMVSQAAAMQLGGEGENIFERLAGSLRGTVEQAIGVAATAPTTVKSLLRMAPSRPSELTGEPGRGRDWRSMHLPLDDVKRAGKAHGATVNDVLMAAVTNGFREVILANGEEPGDRVVRAIMPVSLRRPGDTRSNNQVSMIPVELPVGEADPVQRLAQVVRQTREGKKSMVPAVIKALQDAVDALVPAPISEAVVSRSGWTVGWMADTLVTNVRGPSVPQYFLGQEVRYLSPIIPIGSTLRTVVGINSYNGSVNVSVTGDSEHGRDDRLLLDGIRLSVDALLPD